MCNLFSPRDNSPRIAVEIYLTVTKSDALKEQQYTFVQTHVRTCVCLPGASRTGCATRFCPRDFLRHNEKCAGGRRGSRGNKDPLQWRNAKRYAHRAAKCIMLLPGDCNERAESHTTTVRKRGLACRLFHRTRVFVSLSFFFSFSFSLASFITSTHTSKVNDCRAWTYEI